MANFQDIKLTSDTHDLLIENYDLIVIDSIDRVIQNLRIRLWFFFNEWFLDTSYGLDYLSDLAEKKPNLTRIESRIKREILDVQDVLEITSFSLEFNNGTRQMRIEFQVTTTFGQTDIITL